MNKEIRLQVYNKYKGHCAYCGCKLEYKEMQENISEKEKWINKYNSEVKGYNH